MFDLSKYPDWKTSVISMIEELDHVYATFPDKDKANGFDQILRKYEAI